MEITPGNYQEKKDYFSILLHPNNDLETSIG